MALRYVGASVMLPDYQRLIKTMNMIEPQLVKTLRKRYKQIGAPVVAGIKGSIPDNPPLSGMVTKVGRLSWSRTVNQTRPIKSAVVQENRRRPRGRYPVVSLVRIRVAAAPVVMADMAGRSGAYVGARARTREYDYTLSPTGKRSHRINGQGVAMIRNLRGKGSRYVYPGAEQSLPQAKAEITAAVNEAANYINQITNGKF